MDQSCISYLLFFIFNAFIVYPGSSLRIRRHGEWSYTGEHGPGHWGATCRTGKRQSPVNIVSNNTMERSFSPFIFGDNYNKYLIFEAVNNGHTLMVSTSNMTLLPTFVGGGFDGKYVFQQLHFHWESEHQIDGQRAALEIHFVHFNSKYKDIGIASLFQDGIAVLSVLCDESQDSDTVLDEFLEKALENVENQTEHSRLTSDAHESLLDIPDKRVNEKNRLEYKLRDLLPENVDQWFRYEGSLTTPGCDETVIWTVFLNRMQVSTQILQSLKSLQDRNGSPLDTNYRPVQDLNSRTIFLQVDESENEITDKVEKRNNAISASITGTHLYLASLLFIALQAQQLLIQLPNILY